MRLSKHTFYFLVVALCTDNGAQAFSPPTRPLKRSLHMASTKEENDRNYKPKNLGDLFKDVFRGLAELSLADYKWRSDVFKTIDADRLLDESMARMRGEDPGYVRPMDAAVRGPLGDAEESAVSWLSQVIEEEGRRAKLIFEADGTIVRPIDSEAGGPLAEIEQWVVDWFTQIRKSENLRTSLGVVRPKDMDESERGPLGDAEARLYQALKELSSSETMRYEQSVERGSSVRPMDVPGPLGEVEAAVLEIFKAEQQRSEEVKASTEEAGEKKIIRPMNAAVQGPLGEAEQEAIRAIQRLTAEERERLQGIFKTMEEKRPMEINKNSILGAVESVIVGILRAPQMLTSVLERVSELMQSEVLPLQQEVKELPAKPKQKQTPVTKTALQMPSETEDEDEDWGVFQ